MALMLINQPLKVGDTVFSDSMGSGTVQRILPDDSRVFIIHAGKPWAYNSKLIRSGCMRSDLSWHPKPEGIQLKDRQKQTKATLAASEIEALIKRIGLLE